MAVLDAPGPIHTLAPDADIVRRAVEVRAANGVHFYDGMIVAAAERGACGKIWSEDLSPGQEYFGIVVENPFARRRARARALRYAGLHVAQVPCPCVLGRGGGGSASSDPHFDAD